MNGVLNLNHYLVKEHTGIFKASNSYDVFNPEDGNKVIECREENLGFFTKMFRFTKYKTMTPFDFKVQTPTGEKILQVKRGVTFFVSKVEVLDSQGKLIGMFKQKFFSLGGKFDVLDANGNVLCALKGSWTGWDFKFLKDKTEFAHVTKKWAGIGKELFTSADNYVLSIDQSIPQDNPVRLLIFAAVMCIDMVLKEK